MNNFDEQNIVHVETGNCGTPNRIFVNGIEINKLVSATISVDAKRTHLSRVVLEFDADEINYEATIKEVR